MNNLPLVLHLSIVYKNDSPIDCDLREEYMKGFLRKGITSWMHYRVKSYIKGCFSKV